MAQAVWTGTLAFGLVNIPVKLFTATTPRDIRFRELDRATGGRIRHLRVGDPVPQPTGTEPVVATDDDRPTQPRDGDDTPETRAPLPPEATTSEVAPRPNEAGPVAYEDVVKGYEVEPGRFVTVTREELEALQPEPTRAIEIEEFVDLDRIDPIYFEKSYYLVPQRGVGGERPYTLLLRAMEDARKVGIGRFVLRSKEYLAAVRPMDGILGLETLFFADEVRGPAEVGAPPIDQTLDPRELEIAVNLIGMLARDWDPSRYPDTYRERVLELIESKHGNEITPLPVEPQAPPTRSVADLMAALQASVEAVTSQSRGRERSRRTRRTG